MSYDTPSGADSGELIGAGRGDTFRALMFNTDGGAIAVPVRCYNLTVGNLHRQHLREIRNSPDFGGFRATPTHVGDPFPACSRCCSAL